MKPGQPPRSAEKIDERDTFASHFDPLNTEHYMSGGTFVGGPADQDDDCDNRLMHSQEQPQNASLETGQSF